jgi:hypothetical protein
MSGRRNKAARESRKRAIVIEFFRHFIGHLRVILVRRRADLPRSPCDSCAFNRSTDTWRGFDQTCWNLAQAIEARRPFYCHHDLPKDETGQWLALPDVAQMTPCAAYEAIKDDPETLLAFPRAARATNFGKTVREIEKLAATRNGDSITSPAEAEQDAREHAADHDEVGDL